MTHYLLLLAPSANRVYAGESDRLARAELQVSCPGTRDQRVEDVAGLAYLGFEADDLDAGLLRRLAGQSAALGLFAREGDGLLRPVALPHPDLLDDDLVTIPKYQGKTNEQFTRLLVNVTVAALRRPVTGPLDLLDPLSGRGTTLETAWMMGHNAYGVEADEKAFDAMAAYLRTWLRRKRLKHTASVSPVRREGRSLGRRFDAELRLPTPLALTVFTGDTRQSAALFGKKKFDVIVTDAPYGVVHGSQSDVSGHAGKRDRSPAGLLREALPVWAGQLRPGGALGLSWNTYGLTREDAAALVTGAGLEVLDGSPWDEFGHRVDASIHRDLLVAVAPL